MVLTSISEQKSVSLDCASSNFSLVGRCGAPITSSGLENQQQELILRPVRRPVVEQSGSVKVGTRRAYGALPGSQRDKVQRLNCGQAHARSAFFGRRMHRLIWFVRWNASQRSRSLAGENWRLSCECQCEHS